MGVGFLGGFLVCTHCLMSLAVVVNAMLRCTEIDLKVASKYFGSRFACGSSVTGDDEIVIQGDVKDELFDVLTEKWPQVTCQLTCCVFTDHTNGCIHGIWLFVLSSHLLSVTHVLWLNGRLCRKTA